jgi:hypothetical protein
MKEPQTKSVENQAKPAPERYGRLGHWTDSVIEEAMARGDFDHLPGKGKPLNLAEPDPYAGPEADAYKILKNAGFTPEWITLRSSIASEIIWLREYPGHPEHTSRIVAVNLLIEKHNRLIPSAGLGLPKVPRDFGQTVR